MDRYLVGLICCVLCLGCKSYVQVYETSSELERIDDFYTFENDTVRIVYSFWSNRGVVSFSILNKQDVPLYIDWKKSSYIDKSLKLDYWADEEAISSQSDYKLYAYRGSRTTPWYYSGMIQGSTSTSKVKIERITFIPPKSVYVKSDFHIKPRGHYKHQKSSMRHEVLPRNDKPSKKTKVYQNQFSHNDTPIYFRNYITLSFSESFTSEFHVDHYFNVKSVLLMDQRHFEYPKRDYNKKGGKFYIKDGQGKVKKFCDYRQPTSFFIPVPRGTSIVE